MVHNKQCAKIEDRDERTNCLNQVPTPQEVEQGASSIRCVPARRWKKFQCSQTMLGHGRRRGELRDKPNLLLSASNTKGCKTLKLLIGG